jgi:hypothetical protein
MWVSSSASTTAPSGNSAIVRCRSARIWSRSGSPLATRRGRRHAATSRTRRCRVRREMVGAAGSVPQPRDGPGFGLAQQPQDPPGQPPVAQSGPAGAGTVGQPWGGVLVVAVDPAPHGRGIVAEQVGDLGRRPALLGEQDHQQAAGDAVGAVQQAHQVAGAGGRAGGFGVHAGGRILAAASSGRCGRKLQRPARLLHRRSARPLRPGLQAELPVSRFRRSSGGRAGAWWRRVGRGWGVSRPTRLPTGLLSRPRAWTSAGRCRSGCRPRRCGSARSPSPGR